MPTSSRHARASCYLCDAAASVRAAIAARFAANPKIKVHRARGGRAPARRARSISIFANSLVQYLTPAELERMLALWRRLLAPGGTLIVADVIPPHVGALSDGLALLRYAAANGFLARCADRPRAHRAVALPAPAQRARHRALHRGGIPRPGCAPPDFRASALPRNVEHNPARMTFRARPSSAINPLFTFRMRRRTERGNNGIGPVADWKRGGAATPLRPGSNPGPGLQPSLLAASAGKPSERSCPP